MPARRELTMRQLRQMLRLHHDGVSAREIGRTLGVARSTIQDNLERARKAGIAARGPGGSENAGANAPFACYSPLRCSLPVAVIDGPVIVEKPNLEIARNPCAKAVHISDKARRMRPEILGVELKN